MSDVIKRTNYDVWAGNSTLPVTIHFDCPSYYRGLLVGVRSRVVNSYPTVEYAGEALTPIGFQTLNAVGERLNFYYLNNPDAGENDLIVTPDSGQSITDILAVSYKHVSETALVNASTSGQDGGGAGSWTISPTVADSWLVTVVSPDLSENGTGFANGTNLTFFTPQGMQRLGDSNAGVGAVGSKTISSNYDDLDNWYWITAAISPTLPLPIVDPALVSDIALRSAVVASEVLYDGDTTITERGFVIGLSTLPTVSSGTKHVVAGTVGEFQTTITELDVNTTYYVRSFATNSYGTTYGDEDTFTTLNIGDHDLIKDIGAVDGENYAVRVNVTGTTGTVTVKLGTTGDSEVISAGAGVSEFQGAYAGSDGLIFTKSADFDGTIDDVQYVRVAGEGTIDWNLDTFTSVFPINSSVSFKRIEDDLFNSYRLYRYLDLLFKNLDGFVTVTITEERNNVATGRSKTFSVGNTDGVESAFSKRRLSFLSKNQAIIVTLSNANQSETFSIAQFVLQGSLESPRQFPRGSINSL